MSFTTSSRSVVNASRIRRFSSTSSACSVAAADDRDGQERAGVDAGEVRVAGEAVVAGGVGDDQRLPRPLEVAQHGHRNRVLVARQQPVLPLVAPQQQRTPVAPVIAPSTSATRACSRSMLVSELSACDAARMPRRSIVPVVTVER